MAILLLAPQVPMLFMGEEYAAPQPFLYFCDYTGDLAAAVTQGRRKEFEHFRMFADAQMRERIPDPNAENTFTASRLRWEQRNEGIHREWLDYVRDLLQVRKTSVAPLIPQITDKSCSVSDTVVQATWRVAQGSLQLVANLGKSFVTVPTDSNASLLFATHEYGNTLHPWEVRLLKATTRRLR
jgi:1,4-alpha-glucan branching enzyme